MLVDMGGSQNWGYFFGGQHKEDCSILGSTLGCPYSWKHQLAWPFKLYSPFIAVPHACHGSLSKRAPEPNMSYTLNSLKGILQGTIIGITIERGL